MENIFHYGHGCLLDINNTALTRKRLFRW